MNDKTQKVLDEVNRDYETAKTFTSVQWRAIAAIVLAVALSALAVGAYLAW